MEETKEETKQPPSPGFKELQEERKEIVKDLTNADIKLIQE